MPITEDHLEKLMLEWLHDDLGYTVAYGPDLAPDGNAPERASYRQVVLEPRFSAALRKINPKIPLPALDDAARQVLNPNIPALISANRQFHRWLFFGVPVEYQRDGETIGDRVWLIDFQNPDANDWLAVNQFTVQGPHHTRRPDVVLFINGLPLVVIELKNPADENADLWAAFDQLQTYKDQISDLFITNEMLVITDGVTARMGSLTADKERFLAWRTVNGDDLDPHGEHWQLETLVRGAFAKAVLTDFIHHFVLFEDDGALIKKIAAYHQFHAVQRAVQHTVRAAGPNGDRRIGVTWHTQGSGKSITMAFYVGKIMVEPAMQNPTIVVVTDRNDLDGQLFGTFTAAQDLLLDTPVQATDRDDLRRLLNNRPSGGIIFTTIQKFAPDAHETRFPTLSERRNIVVIADEAHRSQYGFGAKLISRQVTEVPASYTATADAAATVEALLTGYRYGHAQHLRDALPNAAFIAFTGTPIALDDRDTRAVFGDYLHIYDIEQAMQDGATVPIHYESRLAKLDLNPEQTPTLDEDMEELTEDEEEATQEKLKRRWAALEQLAGAPARIQQVAADLVTHFENRQAVLDGKAMIVCMSRDICAHLYAELIKLRPDWHDADPEQGVLKIVMTSSASDKALLRPYLYSGPTKKRLATRFKDPTDPFQVVIVRDMWLTGFDAPCLHTMYADKPMKGYTLMQAIARVNRVFKDKPGGLIVDYIGLAGELKRALHEYTASRGKGRPVVDAHEALAVLIEKIEVAHGMLHGFDYADFATHGLQRLRGAVDHIKGLDNGKQRFCDQVLAMTQAFALCSTLDEAKSYREELAFFQAIKVVFTKHATQQQKLTDEQRESALRQLISRALVSDGVLDIFSVAGLNRPDLSILSDEFLDDIQHLKERNLAVEVLERLLKDQIKTRFATNVVQNQKFSDLLKATLNKYHNRAIETAQVIEELIAMAKAFHQVAQRGEALNLNPDELAFYDALETNEASVRELGEPVLKAIAHELTEKLRANVTVDWSVREAVRAKLRGLVRRILRKYKYPPDQQLQAIETVLRQAETLSAVWTLI